MNDGDKRTQGVLDNSGDIESTEQKPEQSHATRLAGSGHDEHRNVPIGGAPVQTPMHKSGDVRNESANQILGPINREGSWESEGGAPIIGRGNAQQVGERQTVAGTEDDQDPDRPQPDTPGRDEAEAVPVTVRMAADPSSQVPVPGAASTAQGSPEEGPSAHETQSKTSAPESSDGHDWRQDQTKKRAVPAAAGPENTIHRASKPEHDGQDGNSAPLFDSDEASKLRERWDAIQVSFVDEPRKSVQEADNLVAVTVKRLAEQFTEERSRLEGHWDSGDVSTEDLRVALRHYRAFFGRLLSV